MPPDPWAISSRSKLQAFKHRNRGQPKVSAMQGDLVDLAFADFDAAG